MRALIVVGLSLFAMAPAACGSNTGGMAAATAGGTAGQAGISGAGGSGMTTGDSGLDSACPPKKPVDAYDVTPGGGCGVVCDPKNVLLGDGNFTGLDCVGTLPVSPFMGQKVAGCVADMQQA